MRAAADIIVMVNVAAIWIGFMIRHHRRQSKVPNYEHIEQLEEENKRIDAMLNRIKGEGK